MIDSFMQRVALYANWDTRLTRLIDLRITLRHSNAFELLGFADDFAFQLYFWKEWRMVHDSLIASLDRFCAVVIGGDSFLDGRVDPERKCQGK
jgi:hypothetical protein